MLALDITSGKILWRTDVGSVTRRSSGRFNRSRDPVLDVLDPWQNISAPCVDADTVYIAPNCGAVIAVDRFDGSIRWIRPYPTASNAPEPARSSRQRGNVRTRELPSTGIPRASVYRWNTTPVRVGDNLLVVAPHDTDRVFALDARTGKPEWHTDSLASATLFGAAGKLVFLSDKIITALDTEQLESAWTWDGGVVGAATLVADQIIVPTAGGLVTLNAGDGAVVAGASAADLPDLLEMTKSESLRAALESMGVLELLASDEGSKSDTPIPAKKRT
jgi:outer membrane protein assembly factor BamB